MRRRWIGFVGTFATIALAMTVSGSTATADDLESRNAFDEIDADHAEGGLTDLEALLYKFYLVKGVGTVPAKYSRSESEPIRCATDILLQMHQRIGDYSDEIQTTIHTIAARPTGLNSFVDTAHFRIHYTTSGSRVPYQWPNTAYLDAVVASVEECWSYYHGTENWQTPPSDGGAGGGSGLIDIYIDNLGSGLYGYAEAESNPSDSWPNNRTAFLVIDNDYTGFGYSDRTLPMKVTVAHEYHHVVQMGYTIGNSWWMENTATFVEDEVYDSIDDNHAYLSCFTSIPYRKISYFNSCHEYGAFVWPTWIRENYGHDMVRQIYDCSGTTNIYTCYDTELGTVGSSFEDSFDRFWTWNFYTNLRDDGGHYAEGGEYPTMVAYDKQIQTFPTSDIHPTASRQPEATSASVIRFRPQSGSEDNVLSLTFDGPDCVSRVVLISKRSGEEVFTEHYLDVDANGNGQLDVTDWDNMEYAHLISVYPRACGSGTFDYVIDASTDQSASIDGNALYVRTVDLSQNAPNPFGAFTQIRYNLDSEGAVRLDVFDSAGRLVRELISAQQSAGEYFVSWDARDNRGDQVQPGVYFYRISSGPTVQSKKMIVVDH